MGSSDESVHRSVPQPGRSTVVLRLPLTRKWAALPWRPNAAGDSDEVDVVDVVRAADAVAPVLGSFLVGHWTLLRRLDLPTLLTELTRSRPTGLSVHIPGQDVSRVVVQRLRDLGVKQVQVPFHCARQDANDWLVRQPGALKAARQAIDACLEEDMPVTAEVVVTRPTMAHLAETVEVLGRLGVPALTIRRLTAQDTNGPEFVPLSPRHGLLGPSLEQAAAVALQRRMRLSFRDLPLCVAPRLRPLFPAPESELWVGPDGSARMRVAPGIGCASCPGLPSCAGAPQDYISRFGWEEFVDPNSNTARVGEGVQEQIAFRASGPLVFSWRGPHRVRCESCGDPPQGGARMQPNYESTRVIRARLVEAARQRPAAVRVVGADVLAHPESASLLYDAVRLFPHVEVAGEASALVDWTDLDLRRLKDLRRVDIALYGPDAGTHDAHCGIPGAFAAMLRAAERLREAKITVGTYAILHDARSVREFAEAWSSGRLPGEPRFRLSPAGSSLDELVECARSLPPGAAAALQAVLPRCLCSQAGLTQGGGEAQAEGAEQTMHCGRPVPYRPCGSDPIGNFEPCQGEVCTSPDCPGTAAGWQRTARSQRWSTSI